MTTGRYPKRKSKQQRAREQQQAADAALDVKTESVPPSKTQYGKAWTPNNGSTSYVDPIAEQAATSAVDMTEIQAKVNESAQRLAALYEREKVLMDREKELMKREQELATKTSASAKVAWAEEKAVEVEKTAEAPSPVLEPLMAVDCATNRLYRPETHSCRYEDLAWRANPNGPHSGSAYGAQQAYAFPARSSQAEVNWV